MSLAIVTVGVVLGVDFRDELFKAYLCALIGLALIAPLTLIIGVTALVFVLANKRIGNFLKFGLVFGLSSIVSLFCFMATGDLINRRKVDAVNAYVARAVPVLDRIKQERGTYPQKLPVDLLGEPPELLRDYGDYTTTAAGFSFEYVDEPAEWAGGEGAIKFDSVGLQWKVAH